jgi:hypothetical protein
MLKKQYGESNQTQNSSSYRKKNNTDELGPDILKLG